MVATVLEVNDLHVAYGGVSALRGVSLAVPPGAIVAVLGNNGAGKTTLLRAISGTLPLEGGSIGRGSVQLERRSLSRMDPADIVRAGVVQVPEGRHIFPRMTVQENLDLGAYLRRDSNGVQEDLDRVFDLFPRLKEREKQKAGTMSGGEQQMLAIGRALMGNPRILLLDEPSMGIAPILVERIYETIAEINRQGTTILLVEQNANFALDVSGRGYVLETGHVALSDRSDALHCPVCSHAAPTRDFLTLGEPTRPARVDVRIVPALT